MKVIHGDCLEVSKEIKSGSVDLILTDLPYGTMEGAQLDGREGNKTKRDIKIDTKQIHKLANRILRKNGKMVLFAQQPFTTELIKEAIPNIPFSYSMVWEKDHFANSLIAKKAPVSYYEDILVFSKNHDNNKIHELRKYSNKLKEYIGLTCSKINKLLGNRSAVHFFSGGYDQFTMCSKYIYQELIEKFGIDKMEGFKEFEELERINKKYESTFNLREGKKYKSNILKYKKDYDGYHPTQKPVLLLEDLIKTYSNEGDLVVDLTAGSGSTGVACKNTNRNYILIEKEKEYVDIINKRLE